MGFSVVESTGDRSCGGLAHEVAYAEMLVRPSGWIQAATAKSVGVTLQRWIPQRLGERCDRIFARGLAVFVRTELHDDVRYDGVEHIQVVDVVVGPIYVCIHG